MNDMPATSPTSWGVAPDAVNAVCHARMGDPFAVLGPHDVGGGCEIRAMIPHADAVDILDRATGDALAPMERVRADGFWIGRIPARLPYLLRLTFPGGSTLDVEDPYRFGATLGELDIYLLGEGRHHDIGERLGAHPDDMDGVAGVRFAVWAPNAQRVSVVGSFNDWDGRRHPMRRHLGAGVWDLFVPGIGPGAVYKYELTGPDGRTLPLKADPVAWAAQVPPETGSVVAHRAAMQWTDAAWMERRQAAQSAAAPISVYEVHAFSWAPNAERGDVGWDELADRLIPYVSTMGFTHLELMPIMEHPFGGSWGYQPLGQFAPSSRLGPPEGFARFVDRCHNAGVGILLDWVPAHFPTDAHGLALFDGTPLYEHADPREGFHKDWNTLIYNLGRNEVRNFLIGSALHWLEHFHVDGIRVDAVASMLYRDYSRQPGEWVPNHLGGRENFESIEFLRDLSRAVEHRCPGAVLIAEESTAFPNVSRPADQGGLGFHFKWNMGWMHDTLHYMQEEAVYRRWHHGEVLFGLIYAFTERFVLPLSHDEVVYGKGSMIRKMPGDDWQRFASLRAYYGFMWSYPGKKLLFMGCEFAQWREWNHDAGLDWFLLDDPRNKGMQVLVQELNAVYRGVPALHAKDTEEDGFRWVVMDDAERSVFAYLRLAAGGDKPALAVCNFTPVPRGGYRVGVPTGGMWRERINTDAAVYAGSNTGNYGGVTAEPVPSHGFEHSVVLTLPPLATLIMVAE